MFKVALIAAGGGLGAVLCCATPWPAGARACLPRPFRSARWWSIRWPVWPWAFSARPCPAPLLIREEYRVALLVGLLGGFSTFSTYGLETFSLLSDGQKWRAGANVLLSHGLGLGAVWIGYRLAERLYGP